MDFTRKWGLFVGLGVALIALGLLACIDTVSVTLASTVFLGFLIIMAGVMQMIHAFAVRGWSGFLFSLLGGLLYVAAGVIIIEEPATGATLITLFAAICFIVVGIMRCVVAFQNRNFAGWGIILCGGIISLIVGVSLYLTLPWSGLWLIGTFIAVELIVSGLSWVQIGLALRQYTHNQLPPSSGF